MASFREQLRLCAVNAVLEGMTPAEVATVLCVGERSVWRWLAGWRKCGQEALRTAPRPGRPRKLSRRQSAEVVSWIDHSPTEFGFVTERWTCGRVARVIRDRFRVSMNPKYLSLWLRLRRITPQVPEVRPLERDPERIKAWIRYKWPRIKKKRLNGTRGSFSRTKRGFCCFP